MAASATGNDSPTVRGALILGLKTWVLEAHGVSGFDELLRAMSPSDRALWTSSVPVSTSRHPAQQFRAFGDATALLWGRGDPKSLRQVGAHVAFADLASYMKIMMKLGTPSFITARFPRIWQHYFSAGELRVTDRAGEHATIELAGAAVYGDLGAYGAEGWMRGAIEYSGGKRVACEHTVAPDGEHRYRFSWT